MKQKGFILVVGLIFLVLMTMLGVSMFSGFAMDETLSGNYREKSRAIDAAQTALNYTQNWLVQPLNTYTGNWVTGVVCTSSTTQPAVCSNALANPTTLPWGIRGSFTPSTMSVSTSGGLETYADHPYYYIQYIGTIDPFNALYQVTSTSQGGNAAATTVLQVVYQLHATASYLGGG